MSHRKKGNGCLPTSGILRLRNRDAKSRIKRPSSHRMPQTSLTLKCLKSLVCDGASHKSHFTKNTLMDDYHTQRICNIAICDIAICDTTIYDIAKQIAKSPYHRSVGLFVRERFFFINQGPVMHVNVN